MTNKEFCAYRLIFINQVTGYRLVAELGVFDTCNESLKEYIDGVSLILDKAYR